MLVPAQRGLNLVYFSVECGVCWTVPCTTPHSGDDGLGEPPQSMEWRNGIAWTPPLTYVVDLGRLLAGGTSALARLTLTDYVVLFSLLDLWLLLAGGNSVLARLILLFYFIFITRPVAATGRRHLRHRPVDCAILFSLLNRGCHWSEVSPPSPG